MKKIVEPQAVVNLKGGGKIIIWSINDNDYEIKGKVSQQQKIDVAMVLNAVATKKVSNKHKRAKQRRSFFRDLIDSVKRPARVPYRSQPDTFIGQDGAPHWRFEI